MISGNCSGTRYKLKSNPGASFSITCSPSATLEGTGGAGPDVGGGRAGAIVQYKATAEPLEVVLSGGIGPKDDKQYLIGQLVSATIATGGLTATAFNWTVSGGKPFKNWTADDNHTVLTLLGAENESSFTFHFKKNGSGTITTPVHLSVPTGALPANGLDTTLTQTCTIQAPTYSFGISIGSVQMPNNEPQWMRLMGATRTTPDGRSMSEGSVWEGSVLTPPVFGVGTWHFTQTLTPSRFRTIREFRNGFMQDVLQKRACTGILCLDTVFSYADESNSDGIPQLSGDSPGETWSEDPTTSQIEVWDIFNTYILYMPPGDGSCYVPLVLKGWYWKGKAQVNSGQTWSLSNTSANGGHVSDFPDFPAWNVNVANLTAWVDR